MGLLDSVLGVMTGQTENAGGALAGIFNRVAGNPQLLQAVMSMLGNDGVNGGLGGLVAKFQQAGMGDVIGSWIGAGQNQAISGEQLSQVLGHGVISDMAAKLGTNPVDLANQLSGILPGLIDQLTPQGQAPAAGLGNGADLMGALSGLFNR